LLLLVAVLQSMLLCPCLSLLLLLLLLLPQAVIKPRLKLHSSSSSICSQACCNSVTAVPRRVASCLWGAVVLSQVYYTLGCACCG
jgi:hypothetical protein